MSDVTETAESATEVATTEADASTETSPEVDYKDKFLGQQKVNRDLEAKLRKATETAQRAIEDAELKNKSEEEQRIELARREARDETLKSVNERLLRAELKAAAKGKLADPEDAHLFIKLSEFSVSDDGEVDSSALDSAVADLIARKPHLAAGPAPRFDGAADQGGQRGATAPQQLSKEQFSALSPEARIAAYEAGQVSSLMGG